MKITDERIREIEAAEKAATPGPWEAEVYEREAGVRNANGLICTTFDDDDNQNKNSGDPIFIAMSRTAIPELLAEREEVMEALKESVKLQSHYAKLLNMHDGGKRITFSNVGKWLARIATLKGKP